MSAAFLGEVHVKGQQLKWTPTCSHCWCWALRYVNYGKILTLKLSTAAPRWLLWASHHEIRQNSVMHVHVYRGHNQSEQMCVVTDWVPDVCLWGADKLMNAVTTKATASFVNLVNRTDQLRIVSGCWINITQVEKGLTRCPANHISSSPYLNTLGCGAENQNTEDDHSI